jgi:glycosyltransferase involved in cell wall biosynthesis
MVELMLRGFGGDQRKRLSFGEGTAGDGDGGSSSVAAPSTPHPIECYHVNARFSEDFEDIGTFRFGKALLLLRYCMEAIWCRFRHGVHAFYYVPAPGKRAALYRDWIVMLLCRPFFRCFIHHWHAVGLGDWLSREGTWFERWLTHRLLGRPRLSLVVATLSMRDALWFRSERAEVVFSGIPDPFPDFDRSVLPRRQARAAARQALLTGDVAAASTSNLAGDDPAIFRVLFLSNCIREKGLFDTLDAVRIGNERLRERGSPLWLHLTVAGAFLEEADERTWHAQVAAMGEEGARTVHYAGFVNGEAKSRLLRECDLLCFPTYYEAESFGLVVVEAMAAGLSVVATRWRGLAEALPADYPGYVRQHAPADIAEALIAALSRDDAAMLRARFLQHFVLEQHLASLAAAFTRAPGSPQHTNYSGLV